MIKKKQLVFVFVLAISFLCACNSKKESTEVKTEDVKAGASLYLECIEEFRKLVQNEIEFEKPQTGERFYLKDYGFMKESEDELFGPKQYKYALYDMNKDGTPELCMWDWHTYVFKYDTESKEIILCEEIKSYRESERFAQKMEEISYSYWNLFSDVEWSLHDLNGDGIEDLVRKGKEDSVKPIREILDGTNGQRVFIDEIDMGEYYFVTDKGDLLYHWDYNGIYWFESYEKYVFDVDWNIELESGAYVWWIDDVDEVKYWYDGHDHTDMTQDGAYFTAYSNGEEKGITKEEYIKIFESITGLDFEYLEEDLFWLK